MRQNSNLLSLLLAVTALLVLAFAARTAVDYGPKGIAIFLLAFPMLSACFDCGYRPNSPPGEK